MMRFLPYILLGVTVLGAVGVLLYWFFGGEEVDEDESGFDGGDTLAITAADPMKDTLASTSEEFKSTARKSRMIALKESLERSLDSREGEGKSLSAKDRMTMPWFMLVGADGSGKKTILANTGLPLPWGPPIEVDSQRKDAGKWWLFEQAVVLEAPAAAPGATAGAQTLPPGQTVADTSVGWNTLLHMLRRERPDSPLNGIIVTISCSDLMNARVNPDRMEEQADRIRNFLERTRAFLGVRLPLHVLVTKCDSLAGFRSFAEALPESRRHDIFGWANPNDVESRFEPTWVDKGFTHIQENLEVLRDEVLAAPEHVRDSVGVFVFDAEFSDMQEPLKAFVARLMTIGERRPSLFFRGFYFTGDALDTTAGPAAPDEPVEVDTTFSENKPRSTTRISAEIAGEAHNLVFLRSLFSDKIFKEAGLARPAKRIRLARDRRVVAAQAAAMMIALGGGAGLWTAINGIQRHNAQMYAGLRSDADALTRVLSGVAIDLDDLKRGDRLGEGDPLERRARDAAVIELVAQMRDIPSMTMRSPFIPTSWFSPLPGEIRASMMKGVQQIVLPVTRARLQERAVRLLSPRTAADSVIADDLDPDDPRSLTKYLGDVRVLSRNIARYNALARTGSGSVRDLSGLLDYLFGEQLGRDSALSTEDFEEAVRQASAQPIAITPGMATSVVQRSVGMVATVAENAARQLAPRTTPAAEKAVNPREDLEALHGLFALVDLIDGKHGVVASVSDSTILGVRLARSVEDSIRAQLRVAAVRIAVGDTAAPDSIARRLQNVVSTLYQYRLMDRAEGRRVADDIGAGQRLRWDVGRLELGLTLRREFIQSVATIADAFPGQPPDRMRRALEVQLRSRAIDAAAGAQRFTPSSFTSDPQGEIRSSGANLETAAPRLLLLAALLDSLNAGAEARRLVTAGVRQAEQALAMAQTMFKQERYLVPQPARMAAWQGVLPLALPALGVGDSLSFTALLARQETGLRTLARDVAPAIKFLRTPEVGDSLLRVPRLVGDWEAVVSSVAKYERGDASSTMGQLHRYLREGLTVSDLTSCAAAAGPDTTRSVPDIFVLRRKQFHAALVARCSPAGAVDAVASYQKLRALFQSRLAGRYPFVDTTARAPADADVASVREFLKQYDAFAATGDVALRADPRVIQIGRDALAFLDQMAEVRTFMAENLDGGARGVPDYDLLISRGARTLPDSVPAEVRLVIGARDMAVSDAQVEQVWRYGEPVQVMLTPFDTTKARPVFVAGGGWAILKLAQQPAAANYVSVRFFNSDTKMDLTLPTFPAAAPELGPPRSR